MLCPKYVWIYGHGSAWWQEKDNKKYELHSEAVLPTVEDLRDYSRVLNRSADPILKKYFYALKYRRLPSLLDVILGSLGF